MDDLLEILANGDDEAVMARVYDAESLSDSARRIPLGLLGSLRAPDPESHLRIVERHPSGRFELLVLRVPWKIKADDPGSGYHPLIVADQGGVLRAVGFVLPWNEVIERLGEEMEQVMPLSLIWIGRITALQASGPAPDQSKP